MFDSLPRLADHGVPFTYNFGLWVPLHYEYTLAYKGQSAVTRFLIQEGSVFPIKFNASPQVTWTIQNVSVQVYQPEQSQLYALFSYAGRHYTVITWESTLNDVKVVVTSLVGGAVIDYQYNPRMANHFDLYDLDTGEKYGLPLGAWYTNLEQITSQNDIVFDANGVNGEGAQNVFPFTIVCTRQNANSQFGATLYPQYENVNHGFTFVNGKTEELTSYGFTQGGIAFQFGPLKNDPSGDFYAGSTWIPSTHISYNRPKNQLTIQFAKTSISPNFSVANDPAGYINSVHMQGSAQNKTTLVLQLNPGTQYYNAKATWKDSKQNVPELQLSFLPKNVSFKPGVVIFHEANGKTVNQPLTPIGSYPPAPTTPTVSKTQTKSQSTKSARKVQQINQISWLNQAQSKLPIPSTVQFKTVNATLPVKAIPGTYGFGMTKKIVPPKTAAFKVPASLQNKLTAYWIRLNNTSSFYVLAPSGMSGVSGTSTNSSFGLTMVGDGYTISMDTTGGSPLTAGMSAGYFFKVPSIDLLAPMNQQYDHMKSDATIDHVTPQVVMFSYKTKSDTPVLGEMYYGTVKVGVNHYSKILGSLSVAELITYPNRKGSTARWNLNHTAPMFN